MSQTLREDRGPGEAARTLDVLVVGAGFGGLYALHELRSRGWTVQVLEAADGIGGTWYWNRYPGARCDVESMQYSFSFSEEIAREWNWSELYAAQPEILRYAGFVADRLDLRRDIRLRTRVTRAAWDEDARRWQVHTAQGERYDARFVVMATGCLSVPLEPDIPGLASFAGTTLRTFGWPEGGVDVSGKRVGLVGTGSSAIQATPLLAREAARLVVFQRTPNFSVPARNAPMSPEYANDWKAHYPERRRAARLTRINILTNQGDRPGTDFTPQERERDFAARWQRGGLGFLSSFTDSLRNREVNEQAAEFVRSRIREIVRDPATAEKLCPRDHPIGTKRICVDTGYYETFNRENVTLVDLRSDPIEAVTPTGIRTRSAMHELDVVVLATGFDAMTGALSRIEISGCGGRLLRDCWRDGPATYLGMAITGFPNLFLITGPGSPSVFTNMIVSIEQHVEWIAACLDRLRESRQTRIEATEDAQRRWVESGEEAAARTLMPEANSWYMGANVPGKPRQLMAWFGGAAQYAEICARVAADGYEGFRIT